LIILLIKSRSKIIQKLKEPQKQKFLELNQSLNTKSCAEIIELIEKLAVDFLELATKKVDLKKEKYTSNTKWIKIKMKINYIFQQRTFITIERKH